MLVVVLFVGLTRSLTASLDSQAETRKQEQATVLALEGVEYARSLAWAELALDPPADAGDPMVVVAGSDHYLSATLARLPSNELIVEDVAGLIVPFAQEVLDAQPFLVKTYVTEVEPTLRRVVVVVEWEERSALRRHQTSTLIAPASTS